MEYNIFPFQIYWIDRRGWMNRRYCRVYRDRNAELQQSYANFVIPSKSSLFHSSSHWNDWKKFLRHDRTLGKMFLYFFFNYETIIKSKIDISHVKFQSIVLFLRFFIDIYNPSFFYDYNFWSNSNYFISVCYPFFCFQEESLQEFPTPLQQFRAMLIFLLRKSNVEVGFCVTEREKDRESRDNWIISYLIYVLKSWIWKKKEGKAYLHI